MNPILLAVSLLKKLGLTSLAAFIIQLALRFVPTSAPLLDALITLAMEASDPSLLSPPSLHAYKSNIHCQRAFVTAITLELRMNRIEDARKLLALFYQLRPEFPHVQLQLVQDALLDRDRAKAESIYVSTLYNVLVETDCWCIIDADKVYNTEAHNKKLTRSLFVQMGQSPDKKHYLFQLPQISSVIDVTSIYLAGDDNYAHWITRNLLKLSLVDSAAYAHLPFLINADLTSYQREYLELLNIREDRLIKVPRKALVKCRELVVPTTLNLSIKMMTGINWLRKKLDRYVDAGPAKDLLFVSRRDSPVRRLLNEAQLENVLTTIGFSVVVPGEMTVKDQINRFSRARIVVSAHGAALANIVFMQPGSTVIEINSTTLVQREFQVMAELMNIDFSALWSDDFDFTRNETYPPNFDFRIDILKVMQLVRLQSSHTLKSKKLLNSAGRIPK